MSSAVIREGTRVQAVDLFCGIGGLTLGLEKAAINVLAGLDNDEACRAAYEINTEAKFILADIASYDFRELAGIFSNGGQRVLVGCAPCQPFSSHSFKARNRQRDDRWNLIRYFVKAMDALRPDVISIENVRGFVKTNVFAEFLEQAKDRGYQIDYKVVYCPDYGVPQNRSRLVLLGSRLGEIRIPNKTHTEENYINVGDVIRDLPEIEAGEADAQDHLHKTTNLTSINLRRIRNSKPGGSWRDWDESLLPRCYKRKSGKSYTPVYGRMSWDDVAPTITTQFYNYGSGRFGHPEQDRALSLREGALLQTFPRTYDFGKEFSISQLATHIGNAVPPRLGYVIGRAIKKHLQRHDA